MTDPVSRLAVLVVSYGPPELLRGTLVPTGRAAGAQQVVVVDNYSTDRAREQISELAAEEAWDLLTPARNLGFGGGMNVAAARAIDRGAEFLLLLNPDASVDATSLHALATAAFERPEALVAPRIIRPDGRTWAGGTIDLHLDRGVMRSTRRRPAVDASGRPPRVMEWLSGACLAVSADLWRSVGGFDDDYFLYWEDVDLSRRVQQAGGELVVIDQATAVHDEGGTHNDRPRSSRAKSATYYHYSLRNRLLFAAKHLADDDVRRWLRTAPQAAREVVLEGGRRQLVESTAPWTAAWRGTRAGAAIARERLRRPAG